MSITIQEYNGAPLSELEMIKRGKYYISDDGKFFVEMAKRPQKKSPEERLKILKSLKGILPSDASLEEAKWQKLSRI
ncbi:hypothetical protein IJ103_02135 [Candidatus Saccharibacteria bacterium]|nr:hypothetical protein [Candidatus Saccharibacteria bacterium]MBQ9017018.1 hypothetical protein [Candidatus Saccharibacteria bacterium]